MYELNEDETEHLYEGKPKYEAGLDVKYGITSNLTLDLTANTDFAQVEADDQQINLTRYSLFFPEKRDFFLDGASYFQFGREGDSGNSYAKRLIVFSSGGRALNITGIQFRFLVD